MSEPGNGYEYRFRKIEDAIASITRRLENIDEHGSRRVGVIETELQHVRQDLSELAQEMRELRADVRDARHRLTSTEAAVSSIAQVCAANSEKADGLQRSIIVAALGIIALVVGSIATMWLALGGPP